MAGYRSKIDSMRERKKYRQSSKSYHKLRVEDNECLSGDERVTPTREDTSLRNIEMMDQMPPSKIMGLSWRYWTKENLHRVMQAYDIPWTKRMKKQDLAVILGQFAEKHNLSHKDRSKILDGTVEE